MDLVRILRGFAVVVVAVDAVLLLRLVTMP